MRLVVITELKQAAQSNPLNLGADDLKLRIADAERNRFNEGKTPVEYAIPVVGQEIAEQLCR